MPPLFSPIKGAQGFQQSNPSPLLAASLFGSLQVFKKAGMMGPLRERSVRLTNVLETLLKQSQYFVPADEVPKNMRRGFTIITPNKTCQRGAQLSLLFLPIASGSDVMRMVFGYLMKNGVIGDEREPDVIRLAPTPLYNTLKDCEHAAAVLEEAFSVMA
jgi:kynureninase